MSKGPCKREKEKQDQGLSIEETYLQVRDNLGLPTTPELCDINGIQSLGCNLPASRDGCKGCTIGRLKNDDRRSEDSMGPVHNNTSRREKSSKRTEEVD